MALNRALVLLSWLLAATGMRAGRTVQAQTAEERLQRAIAALDSAEFERGLDLLRDLLRTPPGELSALARSRAGIHAGAASLATGHLDSAAAYFRLSVRASAFASPDQEVLNPEAWSLFRSVKESTPAVSVRMTRDTVIRPDADALLMELAVGQPGNVTVALRWLAPTVRDTVLPSLSIDSTRAVSLVPRWSDSLPWHEGEVELVATVQAPTGVDTSRVRVRLTRQAVDTVPHEPRPDSTRFRPTTAKGPPAAGSAVLGLAFGTVAVAIPVLLANTDLGSGSAAYRVPVAIGLAVAGLIGTFAGRKDVPIEANIEYNRGLVQRWEEANRQKAAENARRVRFAPLRVEVIRP